MLTTFQIDPQASKVWIAARSSLHPIHSQADGLQGSIQAVFDGNGILDVTATCAMSVEFPVTRMRSSNPLEQRELHRRIEAKRFPTIRGVVTDILTTETANVFAVAGTVTFRGVARPHSGQLTIEMIRDDHLRIAGVSTFDVRDYGMEPPKILMIKVEPLVEIQIEVVAHRS